MAKKKKAESIWTKDITPGVVAFMNKDVTTLFDHPVWTTDITHIMVGSLAVFGLVVSSLVTTLGVATLGVNVQLALVARESGVQQTAALALGDTVDHPLMMRASSSEEARHLPPPMMGSSTVGMMGSSTQGMFCPKIARTIGRGNSEATTTGDVGQLQKFIANHFGLKESDVVTGHFGSTTQAFLMKFQQEQGIAPAPTAGPLTRAAIARVCGGGQGDTNGGTRGDNHLMGSSTPTMGDPRHGSTTTMGDNQGPRGMNGDGQGANLRHGSSTPIMGSTTMPVRPYDNDMMPPPAGQATGTMPHIEHRPLPGTLPPVPVSTTNSPHSMLDDNSSNAASAVEAVAEIGDGFTKLTQAYLSVFGI